MVGETVDRIEDRMDVVGTLFDGAAVIGEAVVGDADGFEEGMAVEAAPIDGESVVGG